MPPLWTPARVQVALERLVLRAALARRRARWLARLVDASIAWREPGIDATRLVVLEHGDVVLRTAIEPDAIPPIPPGHARPLLDRQQGFTIARFDRVRVLTTELKRLVGDGAFVVVRFGPRSMLTGARLARILSWL
jgi:hypothetical protein